MEISRPGKADYEFGYNSRPGLHSAVIFSEKAEFNMNRN